MTSDVTEPLWPTPREPVLHGGPSSGAVAAASLCGPPDPELVLPLDYILPVHRDMRARGTISFETDRDILVIDEKGVSVDRRSRDKLGVPSKRFVSFAWNEVAEIWISGEAMTGIPLLAGRESGRWFRFVSIQQTYAEVFVPTRDAALPLAVLGRIRPDTRIDEGGSPKTWPRLKRVSARPWSTLLTALIAFAVVYAVCIAGYFATGARLTNSVSMYFLIFAFPSFYGAAIGWPLVIGRTLFAPSTQRARDARIARRRRRRGPAGRKPFHSPSLGLLLKILGVGLLLGGLWLQYFFGTHARDFPLHQYWSWLFMLPAALAAHYGYRLSRPLAAEVLKKDSRPPILYLRAFVHDDTGNYNPDTFVSRTLGCKPWLPAFLGPAANPLLPNIVRMLLGRATEVAEEQFATGLRAVGPLVAIGQPGERVAAGGAARLYVGDDEWKDVVQRLMADASLIVTEAGTGEYLWWEIGQVSEHYPDKHVISFRGMADDRAAYDEFRLRFLYERGVFLPPDGSGILFVVVRNRQAYVVPSFYHPAVLWPVFGTAVNFSRVFEYIRTFDPAPAHPGRPTPPPQVPFLSAAFAIFVWNILLGALLGVAMFYIASHL